MVAVEVGEQHAPEHHGQDPGRRQAQADTAAGVDEPAIVRGPHQRRRPGPLRVGERVAGPEQHGGERRSRCLVGGRWRHPRTLRGAASAPPFLLL